MFASLLVANRGEIACRVIRTARRLGMRTIAVYSEADEGALHVASADEAVAIGPAPAGESYLSIERIIAAAELTGADAIHPGYGFLSETAEFAEACHRAGIVFVGPPADAIRAMGLKDAAKRLMQQAGVPVVPGYHGVDQDADRLTEAAGRVGYPVLIKAVAGGGGKGIRRVDGPGAFAAALAAAQREARGSFGDDRVLVERYVTRPRHIEVQVFADAHGNAVHLFERDCSLQRRHQKVVEEAPAPGMTADVREIMGSAAVRAALAVGYRGAGTVEFIADGSGPPRADGFWFMEMNTRLQVEHPVTEAITGLDLVEWQLRIAAGEPLPLRQEQLQIRGHAFEARLYAEDPRRDFRPGTGRLHRFDMPAAGPGRRVDSGVRAGDVVSPFYDAMIAKLIAHGETRGQALDRLQAMLAEIRIDGPANNVEFLLALSRNPDFRRGGVDTGLIERDLASLLPSGDGAPPEAIAAAALWAAGILADRGRDPWDGLQSFRLWGPARRLVRLAAGDTLVSAAVEWTGKSYRVDAQGTSTEMRVAAREPERLLLIFGQRQMAVGVVADGHGVTITLSGQPWRFDLVDATPRDGADGATSHDVRSPLPGLVTTLRVAPGDRVRKGDLVATLEAMKMEHSLSAPRDAVIADVRVKAGDQVNEGALLVTFEPVGDDGA